MNKGSPQRAGNVTQTTVNPTQMAQLPYLQGRDGLNGGWNTAASLENTDPLQYYPGQTLAQYDPHVASGYQGLINTGVADYNVANAGSDAFRNIAGGGMGLGNSPGMGVLQDFAGGNFGNNAGTAALANTANGAYLGNNPYIAGEYAAASQPVVNAYQTATAPGTDSNFEMSGRYGSGAHANAQSTNEQNLGTTLGNLGANLYGQDYANERGLQNNAASTLAGTGLQAGSALNDAYNTANRNTVLGLGMEPGVMSASGTPAQDILQGGQGLTGMSQTQITDLMNRFYGNQSAPWKSNEMYLNQIGQPTSGSSQVTSPLLGPSPLSSMLGAGVGGLSLANGLNSATQSGGIFGSGGLLGGLFGGGAAATGAGADALGLGLSFSPEELAMVGLL